MSSSLLLALPKILGLDRSGPTRDPLGSGSVESGSASIGDSHVLTGPVVSSCIVASGLDVLFGWNSGSGVPALSLAGPELGSNGSWLSR